MRVTIQVVCHLIKRLVARDGFLGRTLPALLILFRLLRCLLKETERAVIIIIFNGRSWLLFLLFLFLGFLLIDRG